MTAEAWAKSAELAAALGQGIRRVGEREFEVDSRTRGGLKHRIDWALDDALICNCEAGRRYGQECWAVDAVRKEIEKMTTEERVGTALVPVMVTPPTALVMSEREISSYKQVAKMAFEGKIALPKELDSEAKVMALMLYGWELGLRPMTAIRHLYIVNGRVAPSAEVMAGLLIGRYPDARIYIDELVVADLAPRDDDYVIMRLRWPSRGVDRPYTVTWADIKRAGLARDNNLAYPQDRLIKHATKRLLRIYAPDVINGLDAGAPVFDGPDEGDDEADDADLYNPGDDPNAYVDGHVVNRETGEMTPEHGATQEQAGASATSASASGGAVSSPAPAAPPEAAPDVPPEEAPKGVASGQAALDYDALVKQADAVVRDLWSSVGDKDRAAIKADVFERYPETKGPNDGLYIARVTPEHAAELLAFVRARRGDPIESPV